MKIETPDQAQALANLLNNQDFKVFLEMVGDYGEETVKLLLQKPDLATPEYFRGIGGGITNIMDCVSNAPDTLERFKTQT